MKRGLLKTLIVAAVVFNGALARAGEPWKGDEPPSASAFLHAARESPAPAVPGPKTPGTEYPPRLVVGWSAGRWSRIHPLNDSADLAKAVQAMAAAGKQASASSLPEAYQELKAAYEEDRSALRLVLSLSLRRRVRIVFTDRGCDSSRMVPGFIGKRVTFGDFSCLAEGMVHNRQDFMNTMLHEVSHLVYYDRVIGADLWTALKFEHRRLPSHAGTAWGPVDPASAIEEGFADAVVLTLGGSESRERSGNSEWENGLSMGVQCIHGPEGAERSEEYAAGVLADYIGGRDRAASVAERRERIANLLDAVNPAAVLSFGSFKKSFLTEHPEESSRFAAAEEPYSKFFCR